ncbi:class I SAM-dependent methyltransferase [Bacillus tuaregi]|uniref:class I SAM-dependent methyltransferase n=1 Tax=Bacillus tuaregi TaxID=1816695 RepID=UPI0008F830AA|nr:class I SAM-dependent methyltransferase [Bacillus tuaregi]
MAFYKSLAPFYDEIFPVNETACSFLLSYFEQADAVLDVGAGTGNMAVALTERGLQVIAAEPDETMADYIGQKAAKNNVSVPVHIKSMLEINQIQDKVEGIYCIGNTVPHLQNQEELKLFIQKCYDSLKSDERFILQLVNYEKVLASVEEFSFPVIQKDSLIFKRVYEKVDDKIMFTTHLTVNDDTFSNSIPLIPVTAQLLLPVLEEIGFTVEQVYGNFARQEYSKHSPALVVVARK